MPRLFVQTSRSDPDHAQTDADGLRHLRALRLNVGDGFEAIVGPGRVRQARVESLGRSAASIRLGAEVAFENVDPDSPLILAIALADLNRMDTVIEKATELGVTAIQPFRASRSQFGRLTDARRRRWQRIARSACQQSGRTRLPEIAGEISVAELCDRFPSPSHRAVFSPDAPTPWRGSPPGGSPLVLVIGPEGGLCADELAKLADAGARAYSLGPRILRFETAATAALAIANSQPHRNASAEPTSVSPGNTDDLLK